MAERQVLDLPELTDATLDAEARELHVDLWYPSVETSPVRALVVGLMSVRAADEIRVSYDMERDGWKIEQAAVFAWDADDEVCDPEWGEVAFVPAWGRERISGRER